MAGKPQPQGKQQVRDRQGREYSMRVRPFRINDDKIDGAVITVMDADGKKKNRVRKNITAK